MDASEPPPPPNDAVAHPMTHHQVTVAFVDWRALAASERSMVVRLARRGELPADERIRATALRWAHAMTLRPPPKRDRKGVLGILGVGFVVDVVTHSSMGGGAAGAELSEGMFERKTAERLLAIEKGLENS